MKLIKRDNFGRITIGSAPLITRKYPIRVGRCSFCFGDIIAKSTAFTKNRKFCSNKCYSRSRVGSKRQLTGIHSNCKTCGISFYSCPSRNKKFCSHKCFSLNNSGENNPNFKSIKSGGVHERKILMKRKTYKLWRSAVFDRDSWSCQLCGKEDTLRIGGGKIIHADHIKSWREYPELRFDIDNGRTLCVDCHKKTDSWGKSFIDGVLTSET